MKRSLFIALLHRQPAVVSKCCGCDKELLQMPKWLKSNRITSYIFWLQVSHVYTCVYSGSLTSMLDDWMHKTGPLNSSVKPWAGRRCTFSCRVADSSNFQRLGLQHQKLKSSQTHTPQLGILGQEFVANSWNSEAITSVKLEVDACINRDQYWPKLTSKRHQHPHMIDAFAAYFIFVEQKHAMKQHFAASRSVASHPCR